jgi:hypothetical protein
VNFFLSAAASVPLKSNGPMDRLRKAQTVTERKETIEIRARADGSDMRGQLAGIQDRQVETEELL